MLTRIAPIVFVFLWSTGFIGAKFADPYAEPLTTLSLRFIVAIFVLLVWALVARAPWPNRLQALHAFGIGILLHGIYLGGVFVAVDWGLPAGPSALIVSLQPVLTALIAAGFFAEPVTRRQWIGIGFGLLGVVLVTWPKLGGPDAWPLGGIGLCFLALVGITIATPWQKRYAGGIDIRVGGVIQYAGGFVIAGIGAFFLETQEILLTPQLVFALSWMALVLSIGAVFLLFTLLKSGALVSTVSLMYLVPAVTAVIAYFMFDERLSAIQLVGLFVSTLGVRLITAKPPSTTKV